MVLLYKTSRAGEKHGGHRNTWCIEQQLPVSVYHLPHGHKPVTTALKGDRNWLAHSTSTTTTTPVRVQSKALFICLCCITA